MSTHNPGRHNTTYQAVQSRIYEETPAGETTEIPREDPTVVATAYLQADFRDPVLVVDDFASKAGVSLPHDNDGKLPLEESAPVISPPSATGESTDISDLIINRN